MELLVVDGLSITFNTPNGIIYAINDLNFSITTGETLGIVGESGSGKSQIAFALNGLTAKNGQVTGSMLLEGKELLNRSEKQWNDIRFKKIAMIFQDPMTALNPFIKIGKQLTEVLLFHKNMSKKNAYKASLAMLDAVKIADAKNRMESYPHELSGGMKQRIMIAMALLCKPELIIADEPTTALDVTVQAQILLLLNELKKEFNTSILLITHDLGVVANHCNHVLVLYGGQLMEYGSVEHIFYQPQHPYTKGLLASIPRIEKNVERLNAIQGTPNTIFNNNHCCSFAERCPQVMDICKHKRPLAIKTHEVHQSACFYPVKSMDENKYNKEF